MDISGKNIIAAAVEYYRKKAELEGVEFDAATTAARTKTDLIMIGLQPNADRLRQEYVKDFNFSHALDRARGLREE